MGNLSSRRSQRGVNLVELMIVVVVVSILAAIAYPSYLGQVRKTRRAEGKTLLLEIAAQQEKFFYRQNRYTDKITESEGLHIAKTSEGDWYEADVLTPAPAAAVTGSACPIATCFVVQAQPQNDQANDTTCATLQIDSRTRKYFTGTGSVKDCW